MLVLAWFMLKVIISSGVFFGYYFLALRNNRFHVYNRFYLLASSVFCWIISAIKIDFWQDAVQHPPVIQWLTVVANGDRYVQETKIVYSATDKVSQLFLLVFILVSVFFLVKMVIGIIRIRQLINKSAKETVNQTVFVFTNADGTPFSFFKYIFLNDQIDPASAEGQYIIKHELAHVHENHSADKLFLNLLLVIGWFDPFLWLVRKEINIIHEFIADQKAIQNGDHSLLASILLKSAFPSYQFPVSNSFFYSPIKRRILMLTSSNHTRFTYLRRVAILPLFLIICVIFAFGFRQKQWIPLKQTTSKPEQLQATDNKKDNTKAMIVNNIRLENANGRVKPLPAVEVVNDSGEKTKTLVVSDVKTPDQAPDQTSEVLNGKYQQDTKDKYRKIFTKVENPPYYANEGKSFEEYITANLKYPKEAIANKVEGAVSIEFLVNEEGELSEVKSASSKGFGLEEEAIRLIKNSGKWKPGIQNGHKVLTKVVQQINFRLPTIN